jgi:predicted nucleotidyltransferase
MTDQVEKLKDYFKNKAEITLAFLFGSQAKDKASARSDFDIAIWTKEEIPIDHFNKIWQEIENILHKDVDLILLNKARPTVAWAALRGQRLLIRDFKLYLRLFLDISREAEDIQDYRISLWNLKKRYAKT